MPVSSEDPTEAGFGVAEFKRQWFFGYWKSTSRGMVNDLVTRDSNMRRDPLKGDRPAPGTEGKQETLDVVYKKGVCVRCPAAYELQTRAGVTV